MKWFVYMHASAKCVIKVSMHGLTKEGQYNNRSALLFLHTVSIVEKVGHTSYIQRTLHLL